jgi:ElaB/YqjD/DUF883 family membrane-anchored ribosome-binding protein
MKMDDIRNAGATISKDGEKARKHIHEAADTAWEKSRETLTDLRDQGKEAWGDAQKLLQKHPGKAVGLALLAGAAIGCVLMAIGSNKSHRRA